VGRFDGKTEKATPQKREKARKEGTVARSQEVGVALSFVAAVLILRAVGPHAVDVLRRETAFLLGLGSTELPAQAITRGATSMALAVLVPVCAAALVAGLAAGIGQVGLKITPKAAKPKLSRLSPKQGLQRLAPSKMAWEAVRTALKLGLLIGLVWVPMQAWPELVLRNPNLDAGLAATAEASGTLIVRATLLAAVIAVADYAFNRHRTEKELKMSRYDVKREHKDSEGDPLVKAQRRRRAHELSRNRMLRDVSTADVVVTNPTRLAIALRYRPDEGAPRVVAKGANLVAARIRRIAYRHGVTVTEDKPLARALYRRCRLGQFVPAALYEAVAAVLAVAYRRRGGPLLAQATAAPGVRNARAGARHGAAKWAAPLGRSHVPGPYPDRRD
jgi:flagellar biosynthetic protein FlhB